MRGLTPSIDGFQPRVDLVLGLVLGNAVAILQMPRKLGALALDDVEIVIGEVSSLLLGLALHLLPVAFDTIPINRFLRCVWLSAWKRYPEGNGSWQRSV